MRRSSRMTLNLTDYVAFQRQGTAAPDPFGNTKTAWATLPGLSAWPADIRETTGKERVEAGALEASRMATIRVRASSEVANITEADRIVARGQNWNIRSIATIGNRSEVLEFQCETSDTLSNQP